MQNIKDILSMFVYLGGYTLCIILIIYRILTWLAPNNTREKRLNIVAWITFAILVMPRLINNFIRFSGVISGDKTNITALIKLSNEFLRILLYGVALISASIPFLIALIYIYNCVLSFVKIKKQDPNIKNIWNTFNEHFKSPAVILLLTWGIIALFFLFPLLISRNLEHPLKAWLTGIDIIISIFGVGQSNSEMEHSSKFSIYALIYIIVIGVGFAVFKILYTIIEQSFKKKKEFNFINAYSNPIALLAVGVSLLWTIVWGEIKLTDYRDTIIKIIKSFVAIVIIFAVIILVLELTRLLIDMRQGLIRQVAKCLFIALIGQCSLLLLSTFSFLFYTINSAIGDTINNKMFLEVENNMRNYIVHFIKEKSSINSLDPEKMRTFKKFEKKITKK